MKGRICKICAESGIFCEQCDFKIKQGLISSTEIEISKLMYELENKFKDLEHVQIEFVSEVDSSNIFVIITSDSSIKPSFIKFLSSYLGEKTHKNVKVIEKTNDMKRFISQILFPIRVLSINQIWSPDGSHECSIRVSNYDLKKNYINIAGLEKLLSNLLQYKTRIQTY